ncbi:MAG: DNA-directed RNA polymerase subunit omega [Peptococcaceae bacterium]|nr:DNA-directed RNA polymerase subunit omega [Peptococcaceae bacterium]
MNQPSLDVLMEKVDNKYTLVVAAAKCTRMLMGSCPEGFPEEQKPVSMALWKIAEEDITFECVRDGVK